MLTVPKPSETWVCKSNTEKNLDQVCPDWKYGQANEKLRQLPACSYGEKEEGVTSHPVLTVTST